MQELGEISRDPGLLSSKTKHTQSALIMSNSGLPPKPIKFASVLGRDQANSVSSLSMGGALPKELQKEQRYWDCSATVPLQSVCVGGFPSGDDLSLKNRNSCLSDRVAKDRGWRHRAFAAVSLRYLPVDLGIADHRQSHRRQTDLPDIRCSKGPEPLEMSFGKSWGKRYTGLEKSTNRTETHRKGRYTSRPGWCIPIFSSLFRCQQTYFSPGALEQLLG
ncbi:hypothetical protein EDD85DRAFT_792396 [Armillaria nabsnona]|nr:hypothetical protein EDD85DRAFT_792396 [Armillaria nabsnona]